MGIVFRQSVKSSIATFTGAVLGALVIYLSTHYIPKQELGFRQTLTNYAVVSGQVLLLGVHNMLSVYIHRYDANDKRSSALITISLILPFLFIGVATIIYLLFKTPIITLFKPEDIPFISQYFLWLPIFTLLFSYEVVLETYLISQFQVAKPTFIREVLLRVLNLVLILLFGFHYISFEILIYGTVLIYLIPIFILYLFAMQTDAFRFSFEWNVFQKEEKKEIVHFTWYHSLLSVSTILMGMLDTLMLATLSKNGLASVPVYVVAVFIISFLLIPYKAMLFSTFATLAQAFKDNNTEKVEDIFMRSSMNIFIATVGMFVLIVCNMHNAVALLPKGYEAITVVVTILAIGRIIDVLTGMNDQVLSLSNYYKYNFYISILLVALIIIFNWWLIPIYDVLGAAWGTTLALIIYNIIKLFVVKQKLKIQPLTPKTFLVVIAGGCAFLLGFFIPKVSYPFIDAAYRSLAIIIVYGIMLIVLKPSTDLNDYLSSIRRNKRLF